MCNGSIYVRTASSAAMHSSDMRLLLAVLVLSLHWLVARAQTDDICTAATSDSTHCICKTPSGEIDVTSLGNPDKIAQYSLTDDKRNSYGFNPCYGLYSNSTGSCCIDTVACQTAGDGVAHNCGTIISGEFHYNESSKAAYLMYTGGQDNRRTTVNLACDESRDDPTVVAYGDSQTQLTYVFTITHKCACPGVCGDTGGGDISGPIGLSLIILSIAAFGLYFLVGALVLKFKFQKTGADIVPQKDFWISFPHLLKGGFMFTFGPLIRLDKTSYEEL